ncbi:PBP1A family penicillin-binding protein [Paenalkalicoccus suaedae]|uniref:PBP1A family penicillin-binding protein n=1 Tax=Paenalkalicoccus suaedae TaxID=2592382 RepID=A0A859FCQ9_9BACI|nr:PBP1A family penicillin-binding protein [Paenalkalicoccus suaedae]QKS71133.1 PBP1A family penicillin-binding protein [Paenalkalicoccus suaedae]
MSENLSRKARKQTKSKKESGSTKPKKSKKGLVKKLAIALLIMGAVVILAGGITAFAIMRDAPELDREMLQLSQVPQLLDSSDEEFGSIETGETRRSADISDVPDVLKDAVVSIEDVRFYDHFGVDLRRVGGAVLANISNGFGSEGASTITQQVVKNLFFDFDKTITRKLQEQYLAVKLEQQLSKDQILELYLNAIYFSDGRYGVVEAANYYFSKELNELTIEDAALLAGIPQRPNAHNPITNPEQAEARRNVVIDQMVRYEKITAEEGEAAKAVPVADQLDITDRGGNEYQSYIDQVFTEVEEIEGIEWNDIYSGGLKIYTNLDQDLQSHVERVMQTDEFVQFPDEAFQAGITLMDTETGQVRAIGGMRGEAEVQMGFNFATNANRQAGSTSKPIFAYGPAIEQNQWSTGHVIEDEEYFYADNETPVRNFSRTFRGPVSMREALRDSLNVPAVKALDEAGIDAAGDFASGIGIPVDTVQQSYALGSNTVSSYEMAGAYAAFGNGGTYNEPHTVRKIEFPDGQVIEVTPEPEVAMQDYTAFMISDMLKDVLTDGTGTRAAVSGVPIAGKTGSSNFDSETRERLNLSPDANVIPDAWFVGYSTDLTAAVWTGYSNNSDGVIDRDNNEHHISQNLFQSVMEYAHEGLDTADFSQPDSVVAVEVERTTGLLPSEFTPSSEITTEFFVRGTEPTQVSEEFEIDVEPELTGLNADYEEETTSIFASWDFPDELRSDYSFRLEVGTNGSFQEIDTSKDLQYRLTGAEPGVTYTISVTVVSDEDGSEPSSLSVDVTVPEEEPEEEELNEELNEENMEENNEEVPENEGNQNEENQGNEEENPGNTNEPGAGNPGGGNGGGAGNGGSDGGSGNGGNENTPPEETPPPEDEGNASTSDTNEDPEASTSDANNSNVSTSSQNNSNNSTNNE